MSQPVKGFIVRSNFIKVAVAVQNILQILAQCGETLQFKLR